MDCRDIRYSNAPAFQARLKVKGLKLDAEKLAQVNEIFSNKSQHYAKDVVELTGFSVRRNNGKIFHSTNFTLNGEDVGVAETKDFKEFFDNNSANDIAKAFLRVLKKGKANEIFENHMRFIKRNIKSAMCGELKCTEKLNAAKERKDFPKAEIQKVLIENFKNRITALTGQKENIKSVHNKISEKITDTPISSIMYWD